MTSPRPRSPRKGAAKPKAAKTAKRAAAAKPTKRLANKDLPGKALPGAPFGRASKAPNAEGDAPVRAYLDSLPQPQRRIAKRVDALLEATLPGLQRCVKWGLAFYGVGNGWVISVGGFVGHVKVNFLPGHALDPVPPSGQGKYVRGVNLVSLEDIDEGQLVAWIKQAATFAGMGARKQTKGAHRPTEKVA